MARGKTRPNVLLITCDQWRGDCLSAAGHPVLRTPNADALAAEGVLFRRHFAGAAPCAPARACLYTGLYQMNNRVCRNGTPLDVRHDNLARAARRAGYDPTLFGYTDVAPDPRRHAGNDPVLRSYEGVLPGFAVRVLLPEHQKRWLSFLSSQGLNVRAGYPDIHRSTGGVSEHPNRAPPVYGRDQTPSAFLAGEFIRWLSEQDARTPWFAHLSFISPHPPFVTPEPYNTMFPAEGGPDFARGADWRTEARMHPYLAWEYDKQKQRKFIPGAKGKVRRWNEEAFRTIRAIYWGMIAETDAQLGRIWNALKQERAWDDTIVVLTSDHAEMMGDHFMLGKGGFFDPSFHIPLIVRDPSRRGCRGAQSTAFTEAVDIFPTLLELIGGETPPQLDGRSLVPVMEGRTVAGRDAAHWEFDFRSIAKSEAERHFGIESHQCSLSVLRTEQHKYVHFAGGLPPLLFDLEKDPAELNDVTADPAYATIRLNCAERLLRWRSEHLDRTLSLAELTADGVVGRFAPSPA
ncbi:MAG: sulfatase-like hydrolase/transferase [Rhizobiaceae bacterium]|nr:sulfatase-like hydrolase/transferase [Rhizobiaceae bacterium]